MLSSKLGEEGRAMFVCRANLFGDQRRRAARRKEESGGEKERATAGISGRDAITPSSGFFDGGEGGQLDSRVVFGPRDDVFVETSFLGRSHCCCRLLTAVVAKALRWGMTVGRE